MLFPIRVLGVLVCLGFLTIHAADTAARRAPSVSMDSQSSTRKDGNEAGKFQVTPGFVVESAGGADPWLASKRLRDSRRSLAWAGLGARGQIPDEAFRGFARGLDGRIYFTVADRGTDPAQREGRNSTWPEEGACFRMEVDGSALEIFATGLRNPQGVVFNEMGDLFTCEPETGRGDRARWVHLLEGSDSGWSSGYAHDATRASGVWMAERLWWTNFTGRAAYALPPVAHIDNGPADFVYDPGSPWGEALRDTFFLSHSKNAGDRGGLRAIRLKPFQASYELVGDREFLWNARPADLEFGPDGCLYFADPIQGSPPSVRVGIYRVVPSHGVDRAISEAVRRMLHEGFAKKDHRELAALLAHADMRIRLEAQFELERRLLEQMQKDRSRFTASARKLHQELESIALSGTHRLQRIHALWALGNITRRGKANLVSSLAAVCRDRDEEVRVQLARVLGDSGSFPIDFERLVELTSDLSGRVRASAVAGLGKIRKIPEVQCEGASKRLIDLAATPDGEDPWLRHQLVIGLMRLNASGAAELARIHPSPSVRMVALLVDRWRRRPLIAQFLSDPDPLLVTEAARAIHDEPISEALPALADLLARDRVLRIANSTETGGGCCGVIARIDPSERSGLVTQPLVRRVLNAAFRSGRVEDAEALAVFSASGEPGEPASLMELRAEAVQRLGEWANSSPRHGVLGRWSPLGPRDVLPARKAFEARVRPLLTDAATPPELRAAAVRAAAALGLK